MHTLEKLLRTPAEDLAYRDRLTAQNLTNELNKRGKKIKLRKAQAKLDRRRKEFDAKKLGSELGFKKPGSLSK